MKDDEILENTYTHTQILDATFQYSPSIISSFQLIVYLFFLIFHHLTIGKKALLYLATTTTTTKYENKIS